MIVPYKSIELAKQFEGFHRQVRRGTEITAVPYQCPAHFWTIGFGTLCSKDHPPITREEGEIYLMRDLTEAMSQVISLCPTLLVSSESKLAAIVDFTYNLGAGRLKISTLRRKINAQDWQAAAIELSKWVWGGGMKLPGLVIRRQVEANLLLY